MKCYYGEVHSHTTESDGQGPAQEAYAYARDVGKVDYFATTDHNLGRYNGERVAAVGEVAEAANRDGEFAALYGYEMTYETNTGHYGHANILQPKGFFPTSLSLAEWYDGMAKSGETGLGQFNHPGDKWGNFNEFAFDPRIDDIFRLMELRITEYGITCIEEEYDRALRMGWHISPVSNEDTHSKTWTTTREEMGAVLAESLSRETILDAMRKNRTYATTDRSFKLFYKANGEWIGARLKKTGALKVEIDASTEKACGIGVLQLVGEHNRVLAQIDAGRVKSYHWEITIPDDQRYTYVKRVSAMHYAISGPVWVEQNAPMELEIKTNYQDGKLVAIADVKNIGDAKITDLCVEWYPACVSIELDRKPYVSALGEVDAKETARAGYAAPVLAKYTRLVAIARGICNGQPVTVSRVAYLSALTIQRFFCNSRNSHVSDFQRQSFCCFDLYNNTDCEIDASEYIFRYYIFGSFKEYRIPRKIKPHGLLTVWFRGAESDKTLKDFNDFYGTNLSEEDVFFCPWRFEPDDHTRKLTIGYGDEVICRAWIRSDGYHGVEMGNGDCFDYAWTQDMATMQVLGLRRDVKPREFLPAPSAALALPIGKALAEYAEPASPAIRRLAVFSDGCADPAALEARARVLIPEAEEILMFVGQNVGTNGLHNYLFYSGSDLLNEIAEAKPDAVLVSLGGNDCGKGRTDWFVRNFMSCSTTLVNATRGFYVRNIRLFFTMPSLAEEQKVDQNNFVHMLNSIANTLHATPVGIPEEILAVSKTTEAPTRIVPRPDAVRIAVVGDHFSDKNARADSYAIYLQALLGEGYDVSLYAKQTARIAKRTPNNYLEIAPAFVEEIRRSKMDAVISMFGCSDLRHIGAETWEQSFRTDFSEGLDEFLSLVEDMGAKNIVITPFDRKVEDCRQAVVRQKDGMADTVARVAKAHGAVVVDFFKATFEREDATEPLKKTDSLTESGVKLLAELVAEAIRNTKFD